LPALRAGEGDTMMDGGIGMPELLVILVAGLLSVGWRTFKRR
jgi:hypothetical protein